MQDRTRLSPFLRCLALALGLALLAAAPAAAEPLAEIEPPPVGEPAVFGPGFFESLTVGATFTFGSFEQDGISTDGFEPIEWRVLDIDGPGRRALVISVRSLTGMPYHYFETGVTWETCSLRNWLNDKFLYTAFTAAEREAIPGSWTDNGPGQGDPAFAAPGGNDTWDRLFLLSCREVERYFDGSRMDAKREAWPDRLAAPTRYARTRGAYCPDYFRTDSGEYAGWWWLRSPGSHPSQACYVDNNGPIHTIRVNKETGGVRPAMWICFDGGIL